jgi:Tfp pilus assembly pilus retraction ATPase PilT
LAEAAQRELEKTRRALDLTSRQLELAERHPRSREAEAVTFGSTARTEIAAAYELADWILRGMDRGATTLYLPAGQWPFARVDGHVETLSAEPLPVAMFQRASAALSSGADGWTSIGELRWTRSVPGGARVDCQAFSDDRGGGLIVYLPVREAGLQRQVPSHVRNACETREGLIVVSAPFADDVAAMVDAVVSWNARQRPGHVITFGMSSGAAGTAFTSDRQLPSTDREMTAALNRALREQPDVLVVMPDGRLPAADDVLSAAAGRLVVLGVVARTTPRALEALLKSGADRCVLGAVFKAGFTWRKVRDNAGRLKAIADVLACSDRVNSLIEAGDIAGLHHAQDAGEDGSRSLDAALAAAVTRRSVRLRTAVAAAVDRRAVVSLVRRRSRGRPTT